MLYHNLNLSNMLYFQTIVKCDFNLSKAAQELFVNQSTLSKMIARIEEEDGVVLFKRNRRRLVGLTPIGRFLYNEASAMLEKQEEIMFNLNLMLENINEQITIATQPYIFSLYFSSLLKDFTSKFNNIKFTFYENSQTNTLDFINKNIYDIGICPANIDHSFNQIQETIITTDSLVALIHNKHPLVSKKIITWDDISDYPLILPHNTHPTYILMNDSIKKLGKIPNVLYTSMTWDFIANSLLDSNSLAIAPKSSMSLHQQITDKIVYRHIEAPSKYQYSLSLYKLKNLERSDDFKQVIAYLFNEFKYIQGQLDAKL